MISKLRSEQISRLALVVMFLMMVTAILPLLGHSQINLLLLAVMVLSPLLLLIRTNRIWLPRIDLPLAAFCVLMLLSALVWHPEYARPGSLIFSMAWCFYFAMIARNIRSAAFSGQEILRLLRWLVYIYALFLLVQQICTLLELPVPNKADYSRFRLNSLAREPSHVSTILGIVMFFYALISRRLNPRSGLPDNARHYPWLWIGYAWCLFSIPNGSSFFAFPLSLLPWVTRRNLPWIAGAFAVVIATLAIVTQTHRMFHFERSARIAGAIVTLDEDRIQEADVSASERIVPSIRAMKGLDPTTADFWLGHGMDRDIQDFGPTPLGTEISAYVFHVWYNYGFLAEVALLFLVFHICFMRRRPITWFITIAAVVLMAMNNLATIWTVLTLMTQYRVIDRPDFLHPGIPTALRLR